MQTLEGLGLCLRSCRSHRMHRAPVQQPSAHTLSHDQDICMLQSTLCAVSRHKKSTLLHLHRSESKQGDWNAALQHAALQHDTSCMRKRTCALITCKRNCGANLATHFAYKARTVLKHLDDLIAADTNNSLHTVLT
jgi:hypothetical protein